ncbi:MAG: C-GCAxxG-C-C family protein [Dehalococcoidales bacterium]|nr:C-GCAxxG-C-C family protein [Dehalococcoidales bacterium]
MADYAALKKKVDELAERKWDVDAIQARVNKLFAEGIPKKKLDAKEMLANREQILDRVQQRAEEYNFILKNCAQGTALALMEEFGQGSMEVLQALALFPGIGSTGDLCGGITGSMVNFGLFFGRYGKPGPEGMKQGMAAARNFIADFEAKIGFKHCTDIIEKVTVGQRLNPGRSDAEMATFAAEKGFEKCSLVPGIGVRLAAGYMIDSMK